MRYFDGGKNEGSNGLPEKVTMDKSGANKAGIDTINIQLALLFLLGDCFSTHDETNQIP